MVAEFKFFMILICLHHMYVHVIPLFMEMCFVEIEEVIGLNITFELNRNNQLIVASI